MIAINVLALHLQYSFCSIILQLKHDVLVKSLAAGNRA